MTTALIGLSTEEAVAVGTLALAAVAALTLIANVFILKATQTQAEATRLAADATLKEAKQVAQQVRVADKQTDVAERQLRAITRQAQVAERSLQAQSVPRLIPAGLDACRIGPEEQVMPEPQLRTVTPIFLGLINAGNGAAILESHKAKATSGPDGGSGSLGIVVPPALAAGTQGTIKLTPQLGEPQEPRAGMIYTVEVAYHAYGDDSIVWSLVFTVQYFTENHWVIQVQET